MVTLSEDSCRVCLRTGSGEYRSMLEVRHQEKDGQELYKELLGTNFLVEARGYPKMVCVQCEGILRAFYDFRTQCTKNERLMLTFLDSLNTLEGQCFVEAISEDDSGLDTIDDVPGCRDLDLFTTEEIDSVVDKLIESGLQPTEKLVDLGTSVEEIVKDCVTEVSRDLETISVQEDELEVQTLSPTSVQSDLKDDEEAIVRTIASILQSCGKDFRCSICDHTYRTKYDLKRHCYRHFSIEIDKPACDYCSQRFDKQSQLRTHVAQVHPECDHRACGVCGRKFYQFLALRMHQYGSHKPKKKWEVKKKMCTLCGEIVRRLKDHIARVHNNVMYICGLCEDRQYKRREDLVVHMKTTHLKQKFRKCKHCTKTFASWLTKRAHEIKAHTRNFPFTCQKCGYKCCTKIRYEDHMRSHDGSKVYECPICLFGFATVSSLKKHFIHHSVPSATECSVCKNVYFQRKKHFQRHQKVHHKDPHIPLCQCPICPGKPIFSINDINNHFSSKHPDFVMVMSPLSPT